jgi:hypothetical protein
MMPDMIDVIQEFEETLMFTIVTKSVVNHAVVESSKTGTVPLWFEGNLQPTDPRELENRPEGQRKFKWWTLFTDMNMEVDWIVKDENAKTYRIMNKSDWHEGGYYRYDMVEGPGPA